MTAGRTQFHRLTVERVERLTPDSVAVTFAVPPGLREQFAFRAGQTVTVRHGNERRSYSLCAPVGATPRIGVREVAAGVVSGWFVREARAGDVVEVQAPSGSFTPDLGRPGHHVLIAAGSGITPMLSIAGSVLAADPASSVTLLYGNRRSATVMFADEVADLKDAHPARVRVVHVLSREPQEVELHSGRLDADRLGRLLPALVETADVDHWWLCGPLGMVDDAVCVLDAAGVPRERVHRELFWVGDDPPLPTTHEEPAADGAAVTVVLNGRSTAVTVAPGETVLDSAQRARPDLPFACKGGVCGTCRALVTSGRVSMRRNYALEPAEVEAGYVLTCQGVPATGDVTVDYDA